MENYIPPYDITDEMLELTSEIMESLGQLSGVNDLEKLPRLRRVSRIKSIHSSLAIENNTLTIEQVTDVIAGKRVLGPQGDISAVKNAFNAYNQLDAVNPYDINDLLKIHGIMMNGLALEVGHLRTAQVGVYNEKGDVIHIAPSQSMVPELMFDLFAWIKNSKAQMLIKSSVFHYEFEFIHPFRDGNGRMGRLWQTVLLASWKPIFEWIPVESIIKDNQEKYYEAIRLSTNEGKSNHFIVFMLSAINSAIKDIANDTSRHYNHINKQIAALLGVMDNYPMTALEIMEKLKLKSRDGFRKNYLIPAIQAGLIGLTVPEKPTSRNQMYFKI
ncbi:MAG: Fic family protein [Clostridia bacterium]